MYVKAAQINKQGSCHMFRHTMATLMLEGGADTRFIQAMLGHADLKTTQIYTHVAIRQLQEIHRATHPAKLERDKHELSGALALKTRRQYDQGMAELHMTEAEVAKDFAAVLEKIRHGAEIIIEEDARPIAIIKAAPRTGRPISECIALA